MDITYGWGNIAGPIAYGYSTRHDAEAAAEGGSTVGDVCDECNEWAWSCHHADEYETLCAAELVADGVDLSAPCACATCCARVVRGRQPLPLPGAAG